MDSTSTSRGEFGVELIFTATALITCEPVSNRILVAKLQFGIIIFQYVVQCYAPKKMFDAVEKEIS